MEKKLNFNQIKEILESDLFSDNDSSPSEFMLGEFYTNADEIEKEGEFKEEYRKLGQLKCVDEYGGEGQGDDYYSVYHFIDHDIYIKFQGWYASHYGSEYSEMFEVKPVTVTKIEYHAV